MRPLFACLLLGLLPQTLRAQQADPPTLVLDGGGHTAKVFKVLFTPDGKELITVSDDKTVRVWDIASGQSVRVLRPPLGVGYSGALRAAALSANGRRLAVSGFGYFDKEAKGKRVVP